MEEEIEKQPMSAKTIAIISVLSILMAVNLTIVGVKSLDKSANIFSIEEIVSAINDKNFDKIEKIKKLDGGESFINDMSQVGHIFDLKTQSSNDGLLVSFSGTTNGGNSLHPFYVYFKMEEGELEGINWNKDIEGQLVSKFDNVANVKNTSDFPWNTNDIWENYASGNPIKLITTNKDGFVKPGDTVSFALNGKDNAEFVPHNLTHGYIIVVKTN